MPILITGAALRIGRKLAEQSPRGSGAAVEVAARDVTSGGATEKLVGNAIRRGGGGFRSKLIFTSSCANLGHPFPGTVGDEFHLMAHTPYGAEKAICGRLRAGSTRRGVLDDAGPGPPAIPRKQAASAFFSSIIREARVGQQAAPPVNENVLHTGAMPRVAVGCLISARCAPGRLRPRVNLTRPGVSCMLAEQIAALRRIAGDRGTPPIRGAPDPLVASIVEGRPHRFDAAGARALGCWRDRSTRPSASQSTTHSAA